MPRCAPPTAGLRSSPSTDIDPPPLGAGEVRVRVHIGAINFPDLLVIANTYQMSAPLPFVTGSEFAGVVSDIGDGVVGLAVGQRVFGSCFVGAFADEVVVGAGALTPIPDDVDDRVAAAFGVAYKTAYHVLRSVAALEPGEELIVLGPAAASVPPQCSSAPRWVRP